MHEPLDIKFSIKQIGRVLKVTYHSGTNAEDKSRNGYGHLLQKIATTVARKWKQDICNYKWGQKETNLPKWETGVDDPLESDVNNSPQEKVCNSKPREPLEGEGDKSNDEVGKRNANQKQLKSIWGAATYQAVQSNLGKQENSIDSMHIYDKLPCRRLSTVFSRQTQVS